MGFLRQEYWSGVPFPTPGNLPNPGFKPMSFLSLALAGKFFISGSPVIHVQDQYRCLKTLRLGKTSGSQVTQKSRKSQQVPGLGKKVVGQISKWASQNGCILQSEPTLVWCHSWAPAGVPETWVLVQPWRGWLKEVRHHQEVSEGFPSPP